MTKVIEHGCYVGKRLRCFVCGCVFEIEAGDSPGDTLLAGGGDNRIVAIYFSCPECNNLVAFTESHLVEVSD